MVEKIAHDVGAGDGPIETGKPGGEGFDALAAERGLKLVEFHDWQKIDEAEVKRAREGAPREKFVAVDEMIRAAGKH